MRTRLSAFGSVLVVALTAGCGDAQNAIINPGFEDGLSGWDIKLQGDWVGRVDRAEIVDVSADARSGSKALRVSTEALNPGDEITDELRTWRRPKYEILVTQTVDGLAPESYHLARVHIKSPGIAIDEGFEVISDIKPWPLQTYGESREESHWSGIHAWERRLFLPQAPKVDGEYHECVLLKQLYATSDSLEVGIRIRAPWTGTVIIDDVELIPIDPENDVTPMEVLLGMRGAKPLSQVRELNRETTLVRDGESACAILAPETLADQARQVAARLKELAGASVPIASALDDVPAGASIIALGSVLNNDLVARLHFNRYARVDSVSPGPGGYVIWTVAEPYGLALKQNVVIVGGSDDVGQAAGAEAFCALLEADGDDVTLPFLHAVSPKPVIADSDRVVPRDDWGYKWDRERMSGFSRWFIQQWLRTGDLEIARLAREEMLKIADSYLDDPYHQTAWDTFEVGWAWDALEELPVLSDEDRLKLTNVMLAYTHMRPQHTSDWSRMVPRLAVNPTWNHQAKGLSGVYTVGRYFDRFYPDLDDARMPYYLAAARNAFTQQMTVSKPQENAGNYWLITMKFCISYYLGEWDMTWFDSGAADRYAEYFATVCNNKGWIGGFGDTYYCYHGCAPRAISGTGIEDPSLTFWRTMDPRIHWWLEHCQFEGYENRYHTDVEPREWEELLGVHTVPLEETLFDRKSTLTLWGSGGEQTNGPVGDIEHDETFDKISFRSSWERDGEYLLLDGIARGIHTDYAANQISKLSLLGEDLLIGACYQNNNARRNDSVVIVKDGHVDDEKWKGDKPWEFTWWLPLADTGPSYAAREIVADLPKTGLTRTSLREYQGCDWNRHIFWLKGDCFALIDEVVAREPGTYYIESNLKTAPYARGSYPRGLAPRARELLEGNRGMSQAIDTKPDATNLYILTDGSSTITTDEAEHQYINAVMMRQVHEGVELQAGERVTFINLLCGERDGEALNRRVERISPTEGLVFEGETPVVYFGCGQSDATRAVLSIDGAMFVLNRATLATADPARETELESNQARGALAGLADLVAR